LEYTHLTLEERSVIMICLENDLNISQIARLLDRSVTTIWRERHRNPSPYDAVQSQQRAQSVKKAHRTRKLDSGPLRDEVERRL